MNKILVIAALLVAGTASAQSAAEFALRLPLQTQPADGLHALELSEPVYRAAQTADLRDLRIFNAAGEALPLARLPEPPPVAPAAQGLLLVPLPAQTQPREQALADFKLRIEKSGPRATIELTPVPPPGGVVSGPSVGGYLIDTRPLKGQRGELSVHFAADAADYAARVEILGSDDLVDWRTIASGALVFNRQLGEPVERNVFAVASLPAFVRLGWNEDAAPKLASARFTGRAVPAALPRTTLAVARGDTSDSFIVDVPVGLPLTRLHVRAPRDNLALRVRLLRYDEPQPQDVRVHLRPRRAPEHWVVVVPSLDVYRLMRDGALVENEPVALGSRTTALRVDLLDGAGLGDALPLVEAEWRPERIAFVARGPAPFTLAVGLEQAKPGPALGLTATLLPADDPAGLRLPTARIDAAQWQAPARIDGSERARGLAQQAGWSRYVLWGLLLLAVALLALMAWRLAKQLRHRS